MHIAISGASGLIGRTLTARWRTAGHTVLPLVRQAAGGTEEIAWDPAAGRIEAEKLEGLDAVIHLAGESIAGGRWTAEKKKRIVDSRVKGTATLCEALAKLGVKPGVLVAASAIGFYGDRGDETVCEISDKGKGFLAETCQQWEAATMPASEAGIRVVNLRIGIVLAREGGALKQMLLPFKLGLGGRLGSGRQWMSWVAVSDVVRAVEFVMKKNEMSGAVNAVGPTAVRNAEFTRALGKALGRPTVMPLPGFAAKLLLGREMAEELLLGGARVKPARLIANGFEFGCKTVSEAMTEALGKKSS